LAGESSAQDIDTLCSIAMINGVPPAVAFAPRVNFAAVSLSRSHGVGQSRTAAVNVSDTSRECRLPLDSESSALGVGQSKASDVWIA
jgi:hypothetical protein